MHGYIWKNQLGKFDSYKIDLKSLPLGESKREFILDNDFFAKVEAEEIQKGKLKVDLLINTTTQSFEFNFTIEGIAIVSCDRCLDDMELPISTTGRLVVKFGKEYAEEGDDIVIIPEEESSINLTWFMYEFAALSIPLKHVHLPGKCNRDMSSKLKKHTAKTEEDVDFEMDDIVVTDDNEESVEIDPRWDALKSLKEDNN